jgi:hypothetical protein
MDTFIIIQKKNGDIGFIVVTGITAVAVEERSVCLMQFF